MRTDNLTVIETFNQLENTVKLCPTTQTAISFENQPTTGVIFIMNQYFRIAVFYESDSYLRLFVRGQMTF